MEDGKEAVIKNLQGKHGHCYCLHQNSSVCIIYNAHILYIYIYDGLQEYMAVLTRNDVSFLAESVEEEQRENIKEIGTTSPLHHTCRACDHHARGHPKLLCHIHNEKATSKIRNHLYTRHAKCMTIMPEDIQTASQYTW